MDAGALLGVVVEGRDESPVADGSTEVAALDVADRRECVRRVVGGLADVVAVEDAVVGGTPRDPGALLRVRDDAALPADRDVRDVFDLKGGGAERGPAGELAGGVEDDFGHPWRLRNDDAFGWCEDAAGGDGVSRLELRECGL